LELIENSIDANAKNITIEIEEGISIRIIDDGDGITQRI
jgi:DNA mismatch repair protein MutL